MHNLYSNDESFRKAVQYVVNKIAYYYQQIDKAEIQIFVEDGLYMAFQEGLQYPIGFATKVAKRRCYDFMRHKNVVEKMPIYPPQYAADIFDDRQLIETISDMVLNDDRLKSVFDFTDLEHFITGKTELTAGKTDQEIALELNITCAAIRQIRCRARRTIKVLL